MSDEVDLGGMIVEYDGLNTTIDALQLVPERVKNRLLRLMQASADNILAKSQAIVPVGETGDLEKSGHVRPVVESNGEDIAFEVVYGDGSSTPTTYTYGDKEADGYSWFVELGTEHHPEPEEYLSLPFQIETDTLGDKIIDILTEFTQ